MEAARQRHAPDLHPWQDGEIETATSRPAGAVGTGIVGEQGVARGNTKAGLLLPRLQVRHRDSRARSMRRLQPGHVDENAARNDGAVRPRVEPRLQASTRLADRAGEVGAVIEMTLAVAVVTDGIHMGIAPVRVEPLHLAAEAVVVL